jgi:hypothetical protein
MIFRRPHDHVVVKRIEAKEQTTGVRRPVLERPATANQCPT